MVQSQLCELWKLVRVLVNAQLKDVEPVFIILQTLLIVFTYLLIKKLLDDDDWPTLAELKGKVFNFLLNLPVVRTQVRKKLKGVENSMRENVHTLYKDLAFIQKLPADGWNKEAILKEVDKYNVLGEGNWAGGKVSGAVYNYNTQIVEVASAVYSKCAWTNPLHMDVFPGAFKMEAEIVRMVCNMFNGDADSCGVVTSGGTESILLACKAYRDRAFSLGIRRPRIVAPVTAHAAFNKAASFMNIRIVSVPVNPHTLQVDMKALRRAINKNTCMLVASAPHFPHGIIDPVEEIAKLGDQYNIPVHVDSCLGGFLLPFMKKAGFPLPPFDFRVKGVTSISCDTHKYGGAPKGTSVLMYRSKQLRQFQYFVTTDWPGGVYASPSIPGSRSGGIIATCWSTMLQIGEKGYVEMAKKIITTTRKIVKGLKEIKHIYVVGDPLVSVVAIGSKHFNIYRLSDELKRKGWILNVLQYPSSVHLCVTMMHTEGRIAETFVSDVKSLVAEIMKDPSLDPGGMCALYGLAQRVPDRSIVSTIASGFMDACYSTNWPHSQNATKDKVKKH